MYKKSLISWTIAVVLFTTSSALSIGEDGRETGKVKLTDEQCRELVAKKIDLLPAVKIGEHQYSALQSDLDRITIKPIITCSNLYKQFMNNYRATFQSWANRNCSDYIGVWCCPYGGCTFFIVRPYVLCNWKDPIYKPEIPVWEWPQLGVAGDEISSV